MSELQEREVEIQVKDLDVTFKDNSGNDVKALTGVNLDIYKGEFISLLGPSGCGKTTLLRSIADLQEPTDGTIRISGQTPKELRLQQKFGFVFQQPVLFDWRTVKKNVELPLEIMYQSKADRAKRADEMLEMVGLKDFANHFPKQLSGGMQQRVNIARAFGIRPEILLMDEPFSALDYQTRLAVTDDVRRILKLEQKTTLMVTHDISESISMSDRIIVLSKRPAHISRIMEIRFADPELTPLQRREQHQFQEYFNTIWKELDVHV